MHFEAIAYAVELEKIEKYWRRMVFHSAANTVKTMRKRGRTCDII